MEFGLWLMFIFGAIVGWLLACLFTLRLLVGTLRIDHDNPKKDVYRFDVTDIDALAKRKYILLQVESNSHFSHE